MRLKRGVSLIGIQPQICIALQIIDPILKKRGQELVITAGTEGDQHSLNSKHRIGFAIDVRTRDIGKGQLFEWVKAAVSEAIQDALGDEYYVLLEHTHIHIQYNGI